MRLVLITDTHFGVKGSKVEFHDNMRLFFERIFFPFLDNNEWDAVVHLGDVFHDRRKIDTLTAQHSREYFFKPLAERLGKEKKKMHIVCGNHDSYFRDVLDTNNLTEFISYQNYGIELTDNWKPFEIHTEPTEVLFGNKPHLMIPWITKNNRDQVTHLIARTEAQVVFSHLELSGFNFSKTQVAVHGDDPATFSKFDRVFSGHYHYRHTKGNIIYLGSPTQQTWIDVDTTRGFHVFDTETGELEFIENPFNIYENVNYETVSSSMQGDHKRYVRLMYGEDVKQSEVDACIADLYARGALFVESRQIRSAKQVADGGEEAVPTIEEVEDTPTFIRSIPDEDEDVLELLVELYNLAVNEEVVV